MVLAAIERCGFKLETLAEARKRWKGGRREMDTVRWSETAAKGKGADNP